MKVIDAGGAQLADVGLEVLGADTVAVQDVGAPSTWHSDRSGTHLAGHCADQLGRLPSDP